ncbi:hypothetical protein B0H19DRAFT_1370941 [Mycena capillaripes]|nr:hypothetical protein B0H19DRAFT_1370941 [Mycena capillaripes]
MAANIHSPAAMDRCWDTPELTRLIFEAVKLGHDRNRCLSRLARTCYKFNEPALALLWETQYSLIPLLKSFPSSTWEISDGSFKIRSPLTAGDWNPVLKYSRHIKILYDPEPEYDIPLDQSVMGSLIISFPAVPIFPNLREVSTVSESTLFPYLGFLLGAQVTKLKIRLTGPAWCLAALPFIASKCPTLKHLDVYDPFQDDDSTEPVSSLVSQLIHLQTLSVGTLNADAYRHLSGLCHLNTLDVRSLTTEPFTIPDHLPHASPFPALCRLTLSVESIHLATNFISCTDNAPLTEVSIRTRSSTTRSSLAFFSTLGSHCSSSHLRSIEVAHNSIFDEIDDSPELYTMPSNVIQPLLKFPNLTRVELTAPLGFLVDEGFAVAMALSWPRIEHLSLGAYFPFGYHSSMLKPTIMSLLSFSRNCPHLRYLSIAVDATNVQMNHPSLSSRTRQTALEELYFPNSPIHSPLQVAQLLSSIFPSVSRIRSGTFRRNDQWDEVERLVPIFAAVRADERLMRGS